MERRVQKDMLPEDKTEGKRGGWIHQERRGDTAQVRYERGEEDDRNEKKHKMI